MITAEKDRRIKDRRLLRKFRGNIIANASGIEGEIAGIEYRSKSDKTAGFVTLLIETEDERGKTTSLEVLENINIFIRKKDFNKDSNYAFVSATLNSLIK